MEPQNPKDKPIEPKKSSAEQPKPKDNQVEPNKNHLPTRLIAVILGVIIIILLMQVLILLYLNQSDSVLMQLMVSSTHPNQDYRSYDPGPGAEFIDNCKRYCETKDYTAYCTATMKDLTYSADWNRDGQTGRLVEDTKVSVWAFCEDRVYCFLVTECPDMNTEGCRDLMCQRYTAKYNSIDYASAKLKEIYRISDEPTQCCYKDRNYMERCFAQLGDKENWLKIGFVDKGWCGQSFSLERCGNGFCSSLYGEDYNTCPDDCPTPVLINLSNCVYSSYSDSITCDTNCQGTVAGRTTTLFVMDNGGLGNSSIAMDGNTRVGTISFSGGKVTAKPEVFGLLGAVKLSDLDPKTTNWIVSISCQNPVGSGMATSGVTKA